MVMKIIKVRKCEECPYYRNSPSYIWTGCNKAFRTMKGRPKKIPKWCPLEDYDDNNQPLNPF